MLPTYILLTAHGSTLDPVTLALIAQLEKKIKIDWVLSFKLINIKLIRFIQKTFPIAFVLL